MKVQSIKLTEGDILRRFSDMEEKFPRREGKNYFPSLDFYLNYFDDKEGSIRQEANKMIEFVGLGNYRSNVKFEKLEGAAGNILLNADMVAEITIDEDIANNIDSVMATLAHEICHKVLYKHGIYFENFMKVENEIYADLATFYVGFGDLTMKGYRVGNESSGYLSPETYAMAYVLMTIINHNVEYNINGLPQHAKVEIEKASKKCKLTKTKFTKLNKENYNEIFSETFAEIKELFWLYDLLIAVLPEMRSEMTFLSKNVSEAFYNYELKDMEWHKFSIAYHAFIFVIAELEDNFVLNQYRDKFGSSFLSINDVFHFERLPQKLKNIERHCPTCGLPIKKQLGDREYHLICPQCKTHFTIDGDTNKIMEYIKKLDKQRNDKEKKYNETNDENKRLQDEIDSLKKEIEILNKQKAFIASAHDRQLKNIKEENSRLKEENSRLKGEQGLFYKIKKKFG